MKAYDGAVNQQLSGYVTSAEISTDVVSNVQLGGVHLYFVLFANALRGWSARAWRLLSGVFPEERCKVDDDGGTGSFVEYERCGGRGCLEEFTRM